MSIRFNKFQFFAAGDSGGSITVNPPSGGGGGGKESTIEFLSGDDDETEIINLEDKKPPKGETKPTKPTDDDDETTEETDDTEETDGTVESDEEPDIDDELEELIDAEPTDEQLELVTPARRKEILAKYPKLFKDFPYLEKAYYREQQFTQLFPTIDEAKQASEKAGTLDNFEKDLMGGNTETILKAVKAESPKGFNKLVDGYLTTLSRVDNAAYLHVVGNTLKHTIAAMVQESQKTSNENMKNAALLLNQFAFGTAEWVPPKNLSTENPDDNKADADLQRREKEFTQKKFETARDAVSTRVNNSLKATIEQYIDPRKSMTDFVRRHASREAMEALTSVIEKDTRFKSILDRLWDAAFKKDFKADTVDAIRTAYISKARTLLPSVIKKARADALRGMGKRVREESSEETEETTDTRPRRGQKEKPSSQNDGRPKGKVTKGNKVPAGMSSLDFLMSDD